MRAQADYITLHVPSTPATQHLFDAERLAACKPGMRIINTARGDLIDEARSPMPSNPVTSRAPASTSSRRSRRRIGAWRSCRRWWPRLISRRRHVEAQEQVGLEIAMIVRDFLRDGAIRNAVNFPAIAAEELTRLRPFVSLARRLGALAASARGRTHERGRHHAITGALAEGPTELIASAVLLGIFETMLSEGVTMVNARAIAGQRGIDVHESRSSRPRNFTNLLSVKLETSAERALRRRHRVRARQRAARPARRRADRGAARWSTLIVLSNND